MLRRCEAAPRNMVPNREARRMELTAEIVETREPESSHAARRFGPLVVRAVCMVLGHWFGCALPVRASLLLVSPEMPAPRNGSSCMPAGKCASTICHATFRRSVAKMNQKKRAGDRCRSRKTLRWVKEPFSNAVPFRRAARRRMARRARGVIGESSVARRSRRKRRGDAVRLIAPRRPPFDVDQRNAIVRIRIGVSPVLSVRRCPARIACPASSRG